MDSDLTRKLSTFSEDVGVEFLALKLLINDNDPDLSALNTVTKTNLVAALNEILHVAQNVALEGVDVVVSDYFVLHPPSFVYEWSEEAYSKLIVHPLDHEPAVTFTDSAGTIWVGVVTYPAPNQVLIQFNLPLSGKAVLS